MTVRNKLILLFTLIFSTILLIFVIAVYLSYAQDREEEFYKRLRQQAATKVNLLLEVNIAPEVLQLIYKNTPENLIHEEVAIYDTAFQLIYHDAVDLDFIKETEVMIEEILEKGEIRFVQDQHQVVGFTFEQDGQTYIVTAAAFDEYGFSKLENLFFILLITYVIALGIMIVVGRFLALQALKPVTEMVHEVEKITANNLKARVHEGKGKDEITELAVTFNQMLDRLEHSFESQKHFVSNIAHELRTPLAAIITELELSEHKERNIEEYKNVIKNALYDARKLAKLSNSLLDLAKASYDPAKITFRIVRLDEILIDARQQVQKLNGSYQVDIHFTKEFDDADYISIRGNEYLLKVAFANLMENGCKFSANNYSKVTISFDENSVLLAFNDEGIGIFEDDLQNIYMPFYRGKNKQHADGSGIGLFLTQKIIELHQGAITVRSEPNKGSAFILRFSHAESIESKKLVKSRRL